MIARVHDFPLVNGKTPENAGDENFIADRELDLSRLSGNLGIRPTLRNEPFAISARDKNYESSRGSRRSQSQMVPPLRGES